MYINYCDEIGTVHVEVDGSIDFQGDTAYFSGADGKEYRVKIYAIQSIGESENTVKLPCAIGSDIYWISDESRVECEKCGVGGFVIDSFGFRVLDRDGGISEIGRWNCYLSREDAEAALKR